MAEKLDLSNYYTAAEAAAVLTRNSHKQIKPSYIRNLARYGLVTPKKVGRLNIYPKAQIDSYVVEKPGRKPAKKNVTRSEAA